MSDSTSPLSPDFVAAMKRPLGLPLLCLRVPLMLPVLAVALVGDLLRWAGRLGDTLVSLTQDWSHEVQVLTRPVVWSELKRLRDRAKTAEWDAEAMRATCNAHKADIERAQDLCRLADLRKADEDPNLRGFPVIPWPTCVAAGPDTMHQPTETV